MKVFFWTIFMLGFSATLTAQIDFPENSVPPEGLIISAEVDENEQKSSPNQPNDKYSLTNPKYRNGFYKPIDFSENKEKTSTMSTDNGLKERTIDFEPDYLHKNKDSGGKGNTTTQYLGEFVSTGKFVEIYCRDHEYVDGDRVQVMVNGEVIAQSITLWGSFQPVLVTLKKGFNRIEIKALNEGTSSPNTAQFIVYDEMGNIITQNRWNLATGVKASLLIKKP